MPLPGDHLLRKLTLAIPEAVVHHRAFSAFSEGMRKENANLLAEWEQQVCAWEADRRVFCPYELPNESEL